MKRLSPNYLYRLRMLVDHPRFYKPEGTMRRLTQRGLVEVTGRAHPDGRRIEYAITGAGRRALEPEGEAGT